MVIYLKKIVFWLLLLAASGDRGLTFPLDCNTKSCGRDGPPVRFPFRIKDRQPDHCGYPGFDLSCSKHNKTLLHLSSNWTFFVDQIDYNSQLIFITHTEACVVEHLLNFNFSLSPFESFSFNLSLSPFESEIDYDYSHFIDYTFFNCSMLNINLSFSSYSAEPIACLSNLHYQVYAYPDCCFSDFDLLNCTKIRNASSVPYGFLDVKKKSYNLSWFYPRCGTCEAEGKYCILKSYPKGFQTECYVKLPIKITSMKYIITGVVLGGSVLFVAAILLYRLHTNRKIDREYEAKIEIFLDDYKCLKPTRYSYADIKRIANHFKEELGQGAYGTVFRGKLSDEILVAVKLLNNSKGNGEEFVNEVAAIGKIHHVNVVRLIGFCADGFIRALVYEYLPNDSLQKYISSADNSNKLFLGFKRLQDIALGIAKGVEYLHQGCEQRIVHFDIKPQNILLDNDFNPKVSDFGLAKLCAKDQSAVSMTTARGTIGYIAPEVFSRNFGNVSYKSDVYSFGMLVLEMVGGRKNVEVTKERNEEQIYFPEWIYNLLQEGEDLRFQIEDEGDAKIAKKLAVVGLWCIQWNPADRPSMEAVVHMLEGEGENLSVPPNPFSSSGISRTNRRTAARRVMHQELEAISEIE